MYFNEMMFNPQYVNQNYYNQIQAQIQQYQYENQQNFEIGKVLNAVNDLCKSMKNLDEQHQQQAFFLCLGVMAKEFGWDR